MPIGGGKSKKKAKKKTTDVTRELVFKEEGQEYGQNIRLLGDCRLEIICSDGIKRDGHIRGSMRKKIYINMNDIVLVQINEYEPEKCDIILKYTDEEVRKLKKCGEMPEIFKLPGEETSEIGEGNDFITFEKNKINDDDDDEDEINNKKNKKQQNRKVSISDDENEEEEEEEDEEEDEKEKQKNNKKVEKKEEKKEEEDEEEEEKEEEEEEEVIEINTKKNNKPIVNPITGKFASGKQNKTKRQSGNDRKREIDDL